MRCDAALSQLLEAEGPPNGQAPELKAHLAECPTCSRAADRISGVLAGLGQTLEAIQPPFDEADALRWAGEGRSSGAVRGADLRPRAWPSGWGWCRRGLGWGAAAAAVIVAAWISGRAPSPTDGWSPRDAIADVEPVFSIEAPEGARLAVFQTQNPKISVVWLY